MWSHVCLDPFHQEGAAAVGDGTIMHPGFIMEAMKS
jgi:hypothetical protein